MSSPATMKSYTGTLIALMVLTAATVVVAKFVDLGQAGNVVLGLAIAVVKASLVVMFFMHMKYEPRPWTILIFFPLVLVMIIVGSNLPDTGLNGPSTYDQLPKGEPPTYKKVSPEHNSWGMTTPAEVRCACPCEKAKEKPENPCKRVVPLPKLMPKEHKEVPHYCDACDGHKEKYLKH